MKNTTKKTGKKLKGVKSKTKKVTKKTPKKSVKKKTAPKKTKKVAVKKLPKIKQVIKKVEPQKEVKNYNFKADERFGMHSSITYCWYWHNNEEVINPILSALNLRNFKKFKRLQRQYNTKDCIYLPNECDVYDLNGKKLTTLNLDKESDFMLIEDNDYLCN